MGHRHAPRGRIKAYPISGDHPMHVRSSAHSKGHGGQSKRTAILGGRVCRYHGGAAPQVKAAAEKRIEELKQPAIAYLAYLLEQRDFPSAGLGAAKDVLETLREPHLRVVGDGGEVGHQGVLTVGHEEHSTCRTRRNPARRITPPALTHRAQHAHCVRHD